MFWSSPLGTGTINEDFTPPGKPQNPKNTANLDLYHRFRVEKKVYGTLNIETGTLRNSTTLEGSYDLVWQDFTENIKACIINVKNNAQKD
jgi:hypothetical protein